MNPSTVETITEMFEHEVERLAQGHAPDPVWERTALLGQVLQGIAALHEIELAQRVAGVVGSRPACAACAGTGFEFGEPGDPRMCRYCDATGVAQ